MTKEIKKKIFFYSGSGNMQSTSTVYGEKLIKELQNELREQHIVESLIYTPNNTKIKYCKSCNSCFLNGKCKLDDIDDMKKIKEGLLSADMVIFATPVYVNNVSGNFKVFIDRLAYWTHLFRLLGKPVYHIVSSSNSGLEVVSGLLEEFSLYLGMPKIGTAILTERTKYNNLQHKEHYAIMKAILFGQKKLQINVEMNRAFTAQKMLFQQYDPKSPEYQYWKDMRLFDIEKLEDLVTS